MEIIAAHIQEFREIVGKVNVYTATEQLEPYAHDETEQLHYLPQVVVKPRTAKETSQILTLCNQHRIPVTPRGGGTGVSGGALSHLGGLVLATDRMNRILEIDERNFQVTTEPGVITEVLQNAVREKGLFYPPDPASKGTCFIGGNIAENSGGPKAVKYGVVKDYVLNLEVVLPTGEIIWTGANTLKNVTGYNLTQLLVGSEGTLGIITKIVLRLIPLPAFDLLLLAPFPSIEKACESVTAIFKAGITPSGLELMEADALKIAAAGADSAIVSLPEGIAAHLLIEVDGANSEWLMQDLEKIASLVEFYSAKDLLVAETASQKEELWKLRRRMAERVKAAGYTIEEDIVVPRARLGQLVQAVKELGRQHHFQSACYGHAGDGNLHVRIKKEGITNSYQNPEMNKILRELFLLVKNLGGTITAEHGVGLIQKSFLDIVFSQKQIELMKAIKKVFDPNNILNAGKIFD